MAPISRYQSLYQPIVLGIILLIAVGLDSWAR